MSNYDYKILSLDGGGLRCVISGILLKELPVIKYDLIAGTSGGAINASLLALGYTSDEVVEFYSGECGKKIFKPYKLPISLKFSDKFMHKSTYDSSNIDNVLLTKMDNAKLKDIKNNILLTAYDIKTRKTVLFTNLNPEHSDLYLRDIARASSAAPLYFTPHSFNGYTCIDGGLSANNPSLCAYSYTKDMCNNPLIVSIGAGTFEQEIPYNDMCVSNPIAFVTNLIDSFMDGSADTIELEAKNILKENYIRFQLRLTSETSQLDNVSSKNMQALLDITNNAIKNQWADKINRLIEISKS